MNILDKIDQKIESHLHVHKAYPHTLYLSTINYGIFISVAPIGSLSSDKDGLYYTPDKFHPDYELKVELVDTNEMFCNVL